MPEPTRKAWIVSVDASGVLFGPETSPVGPCRRGPLGSPLAERSTAELVQTLGHSNVWHRRMAQRILSERPDIASQKSVLFTRLKSSGSEDARLAALWTLFSAGLADDVVLDEAADTSVPSLRMWAARFSGENNRITERVHKRLELLATDENPTVLAAVATALRQFSGGSLTVNTAPTHDIAVLGPAVTSVAETSRDRQGFYGSRLALFVVDGP